MAVIINSGWTVGSGWYAAGFNQYQLNAWGLNSFGQLGLSDQTNRSSPSQVGSSILWSNIAVGQAHMLGLQSPGTLWAWGSNSYGALGNLTATTYQTTSPIQVSAPTITLLGSWRSISGQAYSYSQAGIQTNGTLWTWGLNNTGQLGLNTSTSSILYPVQVGTISTWTQAFAGGRTIAAIQNPGTLWNSGNNNFGQLGVNTTANISSLVQIGTLSTWTQYSCGYASAAALQTPGTLWTFGNNSFGTLGQGNNTHLSSPVQVGLLSNWTKISSGQNHIAAIYSPGTLWTWGQSTFGQLGLNTTTSISSPVQVGALTTWTQVSGGGFFTAALQSNGTLWSWGSNSFGQLGLGDITGRSSPVQVGALSVWTQVACGYNHTIATQSNGTLWSWGSNSQGQLGLNTTTLSNIISPVQVGALSTWSQIIAGSFWTATIQSSGTIFSWGNNAQGSLGLNTLTNTSSPVQTFYLTPGTWTSVFTGASNSSVALISPGTLWAWGYNAFGQLGTGNTTQSSSPVQVGALSTWTQVSTGFAYATTAIQSPGTLWAWGSGALGQLGNNSTTNFSSPVQIGTLSYWTQTSCGYYSTAAIQSPGTLWVWGNNSFGQLGLGDVTHRSSPVQVGALNVWTQVSSGPSQNMAAIQSNGTLWAWGNNSFGQLGVNTSTLSAISSPVQVGALSYWTRIFGGYNYTTALQSNGTLWAWGINTYGQLGQGNTTNYSSPVQVGVLTTWTSASNGTYQSAGIRY